MAKKTYEDSVKRLEDIVSALERGDASLDESLKLFEEGTKLVSFCNEYLDKAQTKIKELSSSKRRMKMSKKYTADEYILMINNALMSRFSVEPSGAGEAKMLEAMRYSVENGGKRIRPMLTLEFCRMCGGSVEAALPLACAIEFIHTYSLIHDDLPCMDDDDMRRGKPSSHIKFGEANALLAGDSLLTFAFQSAGEAEDIPADAVAKAVSLLARASGCAGMIAGQVQDLENENKTVAADDLRSVDILKTGELIRCACQLGCIAAGADDMKLEAARVYAENLGIAFQIVDDILDVTSDEATLGKPVGSDAENCKNTYVSLLGLEEAKKIAAELTRKAIDALGVFGGESEFLVSLSKKLLSRNK